MQKITPNLWFDTQAEDAAKFYTSIFENSRITNVSHYGEAGPREAGMVLTVEFELEGMAFTAINGGPDFTFDEAVSFSVSCESQEEVDELWDKLTADGGQESQCGWLKDKFGLSWQIVPAAMERMLSQGSKEQVARVTQAFLQMKKFDLAKLEEAFAAK